MIKILLVPLPDLPRLGDKLNKYLVAGFVPLSSCFVPATDGPGGILYTLGQVDDGERAKPRAAQSDPEDVHEGNGATDTLPPAEVIVNHGHQ